MALEGNPEEESMRNSEGISEKYTDRNSREVHEKKATPWAVKRGQSWTHVDILALRVSNSKYEATWPRHSEHRKVRKG